MTKKVISSYKERKYRDKEWLSHQYLSLMKPQNVIGETCGSSPGTIGKWLSIHGIEKRSLGLIKHLSCGNMLDISKEGVQFIDGLLLGDGHIDHRSVYSSRYQHSEKHEEYLAWLSEKLHGFGIGQSGSITLMEYPEQGDDVTAYHYCSKSYDGLLEFRNRWYADGKKKVPKDLVLDPLAAFNWYIGDGNLKHPRKARPFIELCTCDFTTCDVHFLIEKLGDVGIIGTRTPSDNTIRLSNKNALIFLDFISPYYSYAKTCYKYKWDLTRTKKEWEAEFSNAR